MARETWKATQRRMKEADAGLFPWREIFQGEILDAGCGGDILDFPNVTPFDTPHGDLNQLSKYFKPEQFFTIASSHSLEHMKNPTAALRDWLTLVKPGGYIVATTPDWGSYERFTYPSKHNPDHRSSWSMIYKGSTFPIHCHIPTFLAQFNDVAEIRLMRYVEENYNWKLPPTTDQTWIPEQLCEIWNEFVVQKKLPAEPPVDNWEQETHEAQLRQDKLMRSQSSGSLQYT